MSTLDPEPANRLAGLTRDRTGRPVDIEVEYLRKTRRHRHGGLNRWRADETVTMNAGGVGP